MIKYRKKSVLIVDNEEDIRWSLQNNIPTENLHVIIFTASSGKETLSILEKKKIDLIVTDNRLPDISGIDLLIIIKKMYPDTGVIFMTTFTSTDTKTEAIENGGLCFIDKPFDINEMRESIYNNTLKLNSTFFIEKMKQRLGDYAVKPAKNTRRRNVLKTHVLYRKKWTQ